MRIVSTAWISGSLGEFEASCCLGTHAALGIASPQCPLEVFILQGFEKLTDVFIQPLEERNIRLYDVCKITSGYLNRYRKLIDMLGAGQGALYEVLCFLRWLVLEEYLGNEPFVHVDLDLFFQQPLSQIASEFDGQTGTFGSPCLTSIATRDWLAIYRRSLNELIADRPRLQAEIGYGGNEFRGDISSDQDLVNALELCDRLPRAGLTKLHEKYQVFINPIWPYQDKPETPFVYSNENGIDFIGGKPVLFWHLQNNFADYVSRFATVSNYEQGWLKAYLPVKLNLPFIQLAPSAENFAFHALRELSWQHIHQAIADSTDIHALGAEKFFSRTWVSSWFLLQKKGRGLFSSQYWWEDNVFL